MPNAIFTRASTKANNIAEKNPEVLKPSISLSTSKTINTVMIKENSPNVRMVIGKASIRKSVPIVAFAKAIKTPAIIALKKPFTDTPGIRNAAIATAAPINKISIINLMFYNFNTICLISFLVVFLISCQSAAPKQGNGTIYFELNKGSSKIVLKGIDHNIIQSMRNDSLGQAELQSVYSVYPQSANEELIGLEKPFPGKIDVEADRLVFTPDSAFAKGQIYRAEFRAPEFYDPTDVIGKSLPGKEDVKSEEFKF